MRPEIKRLHYILAGVSFVVAFFTYLLTMQPTIPFWDCGEFAAAAWGLQIPHPPGAPLWTIVGRLGMLIPTFADKAARYNLLSVLSSAGSIMLLYLTLVHLIRMWRGNPRTTNDAIITFGGALIGALAYTWTDSFWFNALECEVYAFGSLFISLIPWLMLVWHEHADEPGNERYLLLIAYVIGLSLGVHQLALLTMFPVFMIVYYRKRENVTMSSWLGMVGLSVAMFVVIFIVILTKMVDWPGKGQGILSVVVLALMIGGIIYTERNKKPFASIALWSCMLVFLGYTTYGFVMVRASQNPPMNQNAPSTFQRLAGYINRDQYGSWQMFPRRLEDQKASHAATWDNYTSSADFFWRYQTNFMFHRYLGWNFIGRTDDDQGAGVDPSKTLGLPFMLGLFGFFWHFKRDPKRALTLLAMFLIMGYCVDWYQNQQDPQPRERDYFYVGAFYVFAMWVGIGATGLMEWLQETIANRRNKRDEMHSRQDGDVVQSSPSPILLGALALILVAVPINMCVGLAGMISGQPFSKSSKWAEYSRKNNYVPYEYAYNILQSCEPNAILFTYGDNDTFPLWCLQDVYGIRRDIRIVQLQLSSMMWYVRQLRIPNDWGGKAIKLTTFSDEIVNLQDDDAYARLNFHPDLTNIPVNAQAAKWITGDSTAPAATLSWKPQVQMPSDLLVMDILQNNFDDRPVYYSVTVPENSRAGLGRFISYEGLVGRVTPFPQPPDQSGLGGSIQEARYSQFAFGRPTVAHAEPNRGMILNSYSDPAAHRSAMDDKYSMTYRFEFLRLANWYLTKQDLLHAKMAVDSMEARIPVKAVSVEYPYASMIADVADKSGDPTLAQRYAEAGVENLQQIMKDPNWRETDPYARQTSADYIYADLLMKAGHFDESKRQFTTLASQAQPNQSGFFKLKAEEVDARKLEAAHDYAGAYQKFKDIEQMYQGSGGAAQNDLLDIENHLKADSQASQNAGHRPVSH